MDLGRIASNENHVGLRSHTSAEADEVDTVWEKLIHGDDNGVITIPTLDDDAIRKAVDEAQRKERAVMEFVRSANFELDAFPKLVVE